MRSMGGMRGWLPTVLGIRLTEVFQVSCNVKSPRGQASDTQRSIRRPLAVMEPQAQPALDGEGVKRKEL